MKARSWESGWTRAWELEEEDLQKELVGSQGTQASGSQAWSSQGPCFRKERDKNQSTANLTHPRGREELSGCSSLWVTLLSLVANLLKETCDC